MTDLFDPRWKLDNLNLDEFAPYVPPRLSDAEKKQVWQAYRDRKPIRVPMMLGLNNRVGVLDRRFNSGGLDYKQIFTDPKAMLQAELLYQYVCRNRFNLFCDSDTELPEKWNVTLQFMNTHDAEFFGCPMFFHPNELPDTTPILDDDNKRSIFDIDISSPIDRPPYSTAAEFYEFLTDYVKDKTFLDRPINIVPPTFGGTDGPLTIAMSVRGSDILSEMLDDPEYANQLFRFINDMCLNRWKSFCKRYNQPLECTWMADDSIALISTDQYKEMLLPHHRYFYESIGSKPGQRFIHLCGDATRHFPTIHEELGVTSFDTGFPVDFTWLRKTLGPDVEISGGPEVGLLVSGTPDQVYARSKQILTSGIMEGGRFIFREGNNLPPNVPWANLAAMYKAVVDFGKYL